MSRLDLPSLPYSFYRNPESSIRVDQVSFLQDQIQKDLRNWYRTLNVNAFNFASFMHEVWEEWIHHSYCFGSFQNYENYYQ